MFTPIPWGLNVIKNFDGRRRNRMILVTVFNHLTKAGYCDQLDARLLRMVCGPSCGCANPHALPWFKVPSQGCSAACREEARQKAGELPCSDANNTENWDKFWKMSL